MTFSYSFVTQSLAVFGCLAKCWVERKGKDFEGPHKYPKGSRIRVNCVSYSNVYGESFRVKVPSKVAEKIVCKSSSKLSWKLIAEYFHHSMFGF